MYSKEYLLPCEDVVVVRAEALRDARVRAVPGADDREAGARRRPHQGHPARQDEEPATGMLLFSAAVMKSS